MNIGVKGPLQFFSKDFSTREWSEFFKQKMISEQIRQFTERPCIIY